MTRVKSSITLFASLLLLSLISARAADQKNTSAKEDQLSGTVHSIDQDTSPLERTVDRMITVFEIRRGRISGRHRKGCRSARVQPYTLTEMLRFRPF